MALDTTYSFDEFNDDELDGIDSGGFITLPGFYLVNIEDVEEKDGKIVLTNRVLAGPFKKMTCKMFLRQDPSQADDPKECLRQLGGIIKRLGLATPSNKGETHVNWLSAIGKQAFIQLEAKKQEKGKYAGQVMTQPTYIPYYPVNDDRVPVAAKEAAGIKAGTLFDAAAASGNGNGTHAAVPTATAQQSPVAGGVGAAAPSQWDDL